MSTEPDRDTTPALGAALATPTGRERLIATIGAKYASQPRYNPETRRYDREPTPEEIADSPMSVTFTADDGYAATRGATVGEVVAEVMPMIDAGTNALIRCAGKIADQRQRAEAAEAKLAAAREHCRKTGADQTAVQVLTILDATWPKPDDAEDLIRRAFHLRQNGERAPGGKETWRDWDHDAERYLRGLIPDEGTTRRG